MIRNILGLQFQTTIFGNNSKMIFRKSLFLLTRRESLQNPCRFIRIKQERPKIKVWKLLVSIPAIFVGGYALKYALFYYNEGFRDYLRQTDPSWKNIELDGQTQKEMDSKDIKNEIESMKKSIS